MAYTGKRRRLSRSGGFLQNAARSVVPIANAVSSAMDAYRSRTQTSTRRTFVSGGPTTFQRDIALRYVRKPMPRRRRKRWVKFSKRVNHVVMQQQPLQNLTVRVPGGVKQFAVNTQVTDGQMLGGVAASNNDELLKMFRSAYGSTLTNSTIDKYKIFLKSLTLDIQVSNTGLTPIIFDLYTLICRKSDKDNNRIDVTYSNAFGEQSAGLIGVKSATDVSTTPFQNPLFCSMWKILTKKEFNMDAGQTITFQMRIPYNRMLIGKVLENNLQAIPGFTRAYLFQARGVPEKVGSDPQLSAGEFTWTAQITGSFGVPPSSTTVVATSQN